MKLSIIIPFGLSKERPFIKERLFKKIHSFKSDENLEFIFVEGFSSEDFDFKDELLRQGHIYLKDEKQKVFSQGACRNLGALKASAKVLLFLDIDCFLSQKSLEKILELIKIRKIDEKEDEFFLLPCLYLSKEGSEFLNSVDEALWDTLAQNDILRAEKKIVLNLASASSVLVVNKQKFLELGGFDENFLGHGYEDFDFLARLMLKTLSFEKMPRNLAYDARNWNFDTYEGFRALFSLLGYETMYLGLYALHFYHEAINQNGYFDNREKNHKLFFERLKIYEKEFKNLEKQRNFPLKNLAYKPYLYEIKYGKQKGGNFLKIYISHFKFYRLFRKFISSPRLFFKDMKIFKGKNVLPK